MDINFKEYLATSLQTSKNELKEYKDMLSGIYRSKNVNEKRKKEIYNFLIEEEISLRAYELILKEL